MEFCHLHSSAGQFVSASLCLVSFEANGCESDQRDAFVAAGSCKRRRVQGPVNVTAFEMLMQASDQRRWKAVDEEPACATPQEADEAASHYCVCLCVCAWWRALPNRRTLMPTTKTHTPASGLFVKDTDTRVCAHTRRSSPSVGESVSCQRDVQQTFSVSQKNCFPAFNAQKSLMSTSEVKLRLLRL